MDREELEMLREMIASNNEDSARSQEKLVSVHWDRICAAQWERQEAWRRKNREKAITVSQLLELLSEVPSDTKVMVMDDGIETPLTADRVKVINGVLYLNEEYS